MGKGPGHLTKEDTQMADKHMKRCSTLYVIKELQIQATVGYHYTSIRMAKIQDFPGGLVVKTSPSSVGGTGSIPGRGAKIPHGSQPENQNRKQKQYCNKYNKD